MRIVLTLFFLGSIALSGCADGLTGPESDLVSTPTHQADAIPAPDAEPNLYTTWIGSDEKTSYTLTFSEHVATARDTGLSFAGSGVCRTNDIAPFNRDSVCRISAGSVREGTIGFLIVDSSGEIIAKASGRSAEDYSILRMDLTYSDGSRTYVKFERAATGTAVR